MMDEMDSDRDGFVDLSEFAAFHYGPPPHGTDGDKDRGQGPGGGAAGGVPDSPSVPMEEDEGQETYSK
ncbi:hypothetical protein E2562_003850 [Oryza meyeriana var. granulata]|uniref:EF-hand domain-containing protein n=1 Tax=Oryza meyeriana var. granulata TaxID=110450 RepID=A0A6G1CYQ5_9ORYZ|nr:hypothetical protein E2562_003850 [Oryza meyeriana var. granulata]